MSGPFSSAAPSCRPPASLDLELLLDGFPPLRQLPGEARAELRRTLSRRHVQTGEYLFREGRGPPDHVYFLVSATVQTLLGPTGEERPVSLARPGQMVGWVTASTTDLFPISARVVEPGDVLQLSTPVVLALLGRQPALGLALAAEMTRYLGDLFAGLRAETASSPVHRQDLFPFRSRMDAVMSHPVVSLGRDATALEAAATMKRHGTGSVLVVERGQPTGIVTEQDLVRKVFAERLDGGRISLGEIMSRPVACLRPDDFLFKALAVMRNRHLSHVVVTDADKIEGIVALRDLVALAAGDTLELAQQVEEARDVEALARAKRTCMTIGCRLLAEGVVGEEVSQFLSRVNRELHCRALEVAVAGLKEAGRGDPPVPFCFVLMGSHGRFENHFHTDQDHGMILADYPPQAWERVEPYFMELGTRVSRMLAEVGFPPCPGQVMSSNPSWRKPVREWKEQVRGWLADPNSNAVRFSTLFYDFQPVHGDSSLARELRAFITRAIGSNFQLLQSLFAEASRHRVPLGLFRNFVTEKSGPHKGQLDLKRSGFLFLEEAARILALRHGITETGTVERLQRLAEQGAMPREEAEFVQTAYRTLLHFLLTSQAQKLRDGRAVDNYLDPGTLSIQERYILRHALEATARLQHLVHAAFGDLFF